MDTDLDLAAPAALADLAADPVVRADTAALGAPEGLADPGAGRGDLRLPRRPAAEGAVAAVA